MATIIKRNGETLISIGGEVGGQIFVGNNIDSRNDKPNRQIPPDFAELVEKLDDEIFKVVKEDKVKDWLGVQGNRKRVEEIRENAPTSYQDFMERLGLVEPEKDEADTGAVATRGQVRAGKGGIAVPRNFEGNIVVGVNNKIK